MPCLIPILLFLLVPQPSARSDYDAYWDQAVANIQRIRPDVPLMDWRQWTDVAWMGTDAHNENGVPGFYLESVPSVDSAVAEAYHGQLLQGYTRGVYDGERREFRWQMYALAEVPQVITHEAQHLLVWGTWPLERCPGRDEPMYWWVGHGGECDLLR